MAAWDGNAVAPVGADRDASDVGSRVLATWDDRTYEITRGEAVDRALDSVPQGRREPARRSPSVVESGRAVTEIPAAPPTPGFMPSRI
nr:hypothetical protein [Streptomyces mirabilis]